MFVLHEKLAADTILVTDWPLCRILLMNDCNYPWLVLVPRRHGVSEIHELDATDRQILMEETAEISRRLQNHTQAGKMNVAALGNVVPQLHVHVIARFNSDQAWPRPVFGVVPPKAYDQQALDDMVGQLRQLCA